MNRTTQILASYVHFRNRRTLKFLTRAQTMMEYVIIVALLAVASIPVAKILGDVFRDRVLLSADKIAGGESYQDQGADIVEEGRDKIRRSMKDFHK